ncbi:MAG: sensor histidine kinase, partial [Flammeovirgaceae bacterium]
CLVNKDEEKRNNIKLEINIDEKIPAVITSDERRIKQILVNLISNSIKNTESGSIKLNVESVTKEGKEEIDLIRLSVEDTGIGISKEEKIKLFSEENNNDRGFFNSDNTGGLGLSICRKIIQKIGRDLKYESENEKTKVSFNIYDFSSSVGYQPTVLFDTKPALNNTTNDEDYSKLLKNEIIERTIDKNSIDDSASIILKKNTQVESDFKKEN